MAYLESIENYGDPVPIPLEPKPRPRYGNAARPNINQMQVKGKRRGKRTKSFPEPNPGGKKAGGSTQGPNWSNNKTAENALLQPTENAPHPSAPPTEAVVTQGVNNANVTEN